MIVVLTLRKEIVKQTYLIQRFVEKQKREITAKQAKDLLENGKALIDCYVIGELTLVTNENWELDVVIENCIIESFSGSVTHFLQPVQFINCCFKSCQFVATYFLGGLKIENCTFETYLDFQSGGHNKRACSVIVVNNLFEGFVNFFDCWYENEVVITNNTFQKGTNLLGQPFNIPVTFDIQAIIEDNIGKLDFNNEGDVPY